MEEENKKYLRGILYGLILGMGIHRLITTYIPRDTTIKAVYEDSYTESIFIKTGNKVYHCPVLEHNKPEQCQSIEDLIKEDNKEVAESLRKEFIKKLE